MSRTGYNALSWDDRKYFQHHFFVPFFFLTNYSCFYHWKTSSSKCLVTHNCFFDSLQLRLEARRCSSYYSYQKASSSVWKCCIHLWWHLAWYFIQAPLLVYLNVFAFYHFCSPVSLLVFQLPQPKPFVTWLSKIVLYLHFIPFHSQSQSTPVLLTLLLSIF